MEWYHVYLFTRLDSINIILTTGFVFLCIAVFAVGIIFVVSEGEVPAKDWTQKHGLKFGAGAVAWLALCVAVPTQKEAAAIYLLPKLAHSDFAKEAGQIPTDAAKLMRLKLESWIADMEPKKAAK